MEILFFVTMFPVFEQEDGLYIQRGEVRHLEVRFCFVAEIIQILRSRPTVLTENKICIILAKNPNDGD